MKLNAYGGSATLVWVLLVAASVITTWFLSKDAFTPAVAAVGSIGIAAFKIRLVLIHFMDLKEAPWPLRMVFEAWTAVVTLGILGLFISGTQ